MSETPFNPLEITKLGEIIALELVSRTICPLSPIPRRTPFDGAGVYAIYYDGDFRPYTPLVESNRRLRVENGMEAPIYVGKAMPEGSRRGGAPIVLRATRENAEALSNTRIRAARPKRPLHERLLGHAHSIRNAGATINLDHFNCRWLVVEETFIALAEQRLIRKFMPIWNVVLYGFGNNQPGSRRPQNRSQWDTVHTGRSWAANLPENEMNHEEILVNLARYLAGEEAIIVDPDTAAEEV